jgi:hypothetical protein
VARVITMATFDSRRVFKITVSLVDFVEAERLIQTSDGTVFSSYFFNGFISFWNGEGVRGGLAFAWMVSRPYLWYELDTEPG